MRQRNNIIIISFHYYYFALTFSRNQTSQTNQPSTELVRTRDGDEDQMQIKNSAKINVPWWWSDRTEIKIRNHFHTHTHWHYQELDNGMPGTVHSACKTKTKTTNHRKNTQRKHENNNIFRVQRNIEMEKTASSTQSENTRERRVICWNG